METKRAKPTNIEFQKEFNGTNGTIYYFRIDFENGDSGQFSSAKKEQDKFRVGVEEDYTIETKVNGKYTNIIIGKPSASKGGFKQSAPKGNESFALSYAKDIQCAHIAAGKEFKTAETLKVADAFFDWLESKRK